MKKSIMIAAAAMLLFWGIPHIAFAEEKQETMSEDNVKLTDEQLKEVRGIHQNILNEKKKLIQKYVEYGKLSEEEGTKVISRFEHHFQMMEKNGFMMPPNRIHFGKPDKEEK